MTYREYQDKLRKACQEITDEYVSSNTAYRKGDEVELKNGTWGRIDGINIDFHGTLEFQVAIKDDWRRTMFVTENEIKGIVNEE